MLSNYSRSWTACAVMISSFIHSKVFVTRVKSLENDRQGRSRREYCVQETAVWPKMFNVNRERRHGQRLLLYLARLFKFRSRPHRSACAFRSLSSFLFFTNGDWSVHPVVPQRQDSKEQKTKALGAHSCKVLPDCTTRMRDGGAAD